MAPWDRWLARRYQTRIAALPTRIASAQPIADSPNLLLRGGTMRQPWQEQARRYGREVGVVRFSAGLTSSVVSRCQMVAERLVDPANRTWQRADDPIANAVIGTYRNDKDEPSDLVRRHVWHYQIVGECLQTLEQRGDTVQWFIYPTFSAEIYPQRPVLVRDMPGGSIFNGGAHEVPPEQVNRFWTADEDYQLLATSPMVGILEDCDRYVLLGRRTKREAKSALGMNGAWWTPESAHKYPAQSDGKPSAYSTLDRDMANIAQKAWDEEESLASIAPFSIHYGEANDQNLHEPKWIKIGEALDPHLFEARREALECIVRGLPIPNVVGIEGTAGADANHWNGWLISEDWFKSSIAPIADTIYHGDLTRTVLRPSLRRLAAAGRWVGNPDEWRIGYDPTPVIIHPDKAGRSIEIYKIGGLARERMLEENGFTAEDAPSDDELAKFVETQRSLRVSTFGGGASADAGTTSETPPANPVAAALSPYPSEMGGWLEDTRV